MKEQRRGRPAKYSFEQKKEIIDRYFCTEISCDTSKMGEHGIFEKLATYARCLPDDKDPHSLKYPNIKATDFSKSPEVREYINLLAGGDQNLLYPDAPILAFAPLDVDALLLSSPDNIAQSLRNYNEQMRKMYTHYVAQMGLKTENAVLQGRIHVLETENQQLLEELKAAKRERKSLLQDYRYLKKYVRQHVTDKTAVQVLSACTFEKSVENAGDSGFDEIRADQKRRTEAIRETGPMPVPKKPEVEKIMDDVTRLLFIEEDGGDNE